MKMVNRTCDLLATYSYYYCT